MDNDILVTGGSRFPSITWRGVCPWASLFCGIAAVCIMTGVLFLHWNPSVLFVNALIVASIALPLLTEDSLPALLGFVAAASAFLIELFLILLSATHPH